MNDNKKSGPEFAPIRNYVKSFPIIVRIYDDNDQLIRQETMDYGKADDRSWLGKLSYWAWEQGHSVETTRAE